VLVPGLLSFKSTRSWSADPRAGERTFQLQQPFGMSRVPQLLLHDAGGGIIASW
jgi:hypothetical protein